MSHPVWLWLAVVAALGLDRLWGEVSRWHPLVGFGNATLWLEKRLNPMHGAAHKKPLPDGATPPTPRPLRDWLYGVLAWSLLVLIPAGAYACAHQALQPHLPALGLWLVDTLVLYVVIGGRSLLEHAEAIATPLLAGDLAQARLRVSYIVSRDTSQLDETACAKAACESVLENGNDAIFGAIFWFVLLGAPGAIAFRCANTLDAMWGYRTPRFVHFGRCAARMDDAFNYLPARLTALSYALLGHTRQALRCWRQQAPHWDSPNAGPVMAAGAGALNIQLGGNAIYHGHEEQRVTLGAGHPPTAQDIHSACRLVQKTVWLWGVTLGGLTTTASYWLG